MKGASVVRPSKRLLKRLLLVFFFNFGVFIQAVEGNIVNPTGNISINQIIRWVTLHNFEINAAWKNIESKKALVIQSRVFPNPEVEWELENIVGTGATKGIDTGEAIAKVSTRIELGKKRRYRIKAAKLSKRRAELDYISVRNHTIKRASQLGIEVLRQQEKLILDQERLKINQKRLDTITIKVRKGRLSVVEKKRANILVAQSHLLIKKRKQSLTKVKDQLSITWGYPHAVFEIMDGNLDFLGLLPKFDQLKNQVLNYSELKKKQVELELAAVAIDIERSMGVQDVAIAGGVKFDNTSNDRSFVVSIGRPIAIFDRNKGSVDASKLTLKQKELRYQDELIKVQNRVETLYFEIQLLNAIINSLSKEIISQSEEVFTMLQSGYLKGKISYLEVLESQNTLFDFKENFIDTLADYHNAVFEIQLLTGSLLKGETN
jgi:cobalt-zinc-cadmium efflux system outer membrane protein